MHWVTTTQGSPTATSDLGSIQLIQCKRKVAPLNKLGVSYCVLLLYWCVESNLVLFWPCWIFLKSVI